MYTADMLSANEEEHHEKKNFSNWFDTVYDRRYGADRLRRKQGLLIVAASLLAEHGL